MTIREKIETEITTAMKRSMVLRSAETEAEKAAAHKNEVRLSTLRQMKGDLVAAETAGKSRVELNDFAVEEILTKALNTRLESAEIFRDAGSTERVERELAEVEVIKEFVTAKLSEAETRELIVNLIKEKSLEGAGKRGIGQVMGALKSRVDIDKKLASAIAGKLLAD